ncbi:MAG: glycosyltransferase [Actinobacteria bacterium]|nr:glycosyltransferase [Actinomycetota bacterium]
MKDILTFPEISISIVNLNGEKYLKDCLDSIKKLNYPQDKLEIILVDNSSTDKSLNLVSSGYPQVKIIKNGKNMGFAYANNQAARAAKGEYVAFLNNDTRVDKDWLLELLRPIYRDKEVVASGSKVLSFDGEKIDFVGGMINFEGKGFQIDYGVPVEEDNYNKYAFLPFVNGGAMLVNRRVFLDVGGFDEDFFAYYEDVDFGWRLWVLGYKVIFSPKSIVYHHHHGTSEAISEDKLRFLKERNSIYSVFKNYDDENLPMAYSGTLSNIFNRVFTDIKFDYKKYYDLSDLVSKGLKAKDVIISDEPLSSLMAVRDFFDNLPKLIEKRRNIQSRRKRDDKAIFAHFKGQFLAVSPDPDYQKNQINILKSLGIYKIFEKGIKRNLLIISNEVVSSEMAGPAIRVFNFARVLSQYMNVTLAVPNKIDLPKEDFEIIQFRDDWQLRQIIERVDIILCVGMTFARYRSIKDSGKFLIIDIYDPYNLATLAEYETESMKKRLEIHKSIHEIFNEQLYYGDFFICASERQRDFWLGMLTALNRVNPYSYNQDPTLQKMISVVPFGLPSNRPMHTRNALKGVIENVNKNDFVIIWGGGIYNWFDPLTLIKAMEKVSKLRDDIKLFFMGIKHPNPEVKELQMINETINLAKKLKVYNKNVIFNFGWVDYNDRQNYLLDADAGIITHPNHIETRFSFRTRILDYLWTGLPIISTEGDYLSTLIEKNGLGIITRDGNVQDLVDAIIKLSQDKKFYDQCVKNIRNIVKEFTWEKICQPIVEFCRDPVSSACKYRETSDNLKNSGNNKNSYGDHLTDRKGIFYLSRRFFYHLFHSGPRKTTIFLSNYLREKSGK